MAIAPVVIEFLAKGMPRVQQAFKSIHEAAVRAEQAQVASTEKAERTKTESVGKWAKARERIQDRSATMAGQFYKKQARVEVAEEKKAADAKYNAIKRGVERAKAAHKELDAWQVGARKQQEAAHKRAEESRYRDTKYRIDRTKQAEKDLDSWQNGVRKQQEADAKRAAAQEPKAKPGGYNRSAAGRVVETALGTTVRGVFSGLNRAGNIAMGLATTAGQLGGGFGLTDSITQEQEARKQAAGISARSMLSGKGEFSTKQILDRAKAVSISENMDVADVMTGLDRMAKLTGNTGSAMNAIGGVAQIATATGADIGTITGLAGNIFARDENISTKDLLKELRVFTKQSVVGGVELEDFARYGSRITAASSMYGGDEMKNMATMGALAQIARQHGSASTAAEATMGSQRFSTDVAKKSGKLKKDWGIDVLDGQGNLKDAQSIILDMVQKTGGHVDKLYGMVGDRGVRPLEGAANIYKKAGGGERGIEALKAELEKYSKGVSDKEIEDARQRALEEQKFEIDMRKLRMEMGEKLLPVIKQMIGPLSVLIPQFIKAAEVGIPAFTKLAETVAGFVKVNEGIINSIAANPVGSLIAFELTKSFAAAGLPALLRGLFSGAFGNVGVPIPGATPGAAPGAAGAVPGASPLAPVLALAGGAVQVQQLGGVALSIIDAKGRGEGRAREISKLDPESAAKEIAKLKGQAGDGATGAAWLERATTATNAVAGGGLGLLVNYLTDAIMEKTTGTGSTQRSKDALEAAQTLQVLEQIAKNTARSNNSGSGGTGRSEPVINR